MKTTFSAEQSRYDSALPTDDAPCQERVGGPSRYDYASLDGYGFAQAMANRRKLPAVETPASRTTDPQTSHFAERQITASGKRATHQREILDLLTRCNGRTSAELAALAAGEGRGHLDRHEVARRLPELETAGLVRKGATVECRSNGTKAVSWWAK